MNVLDFDFVTGLLGKCNPPCLSLYQPTHRHHPENRQDLIRFRNLVKALEESLLQKYSRKDIQTLLEPFLGLAEDHGFWRHSLDGLVVLGAKDIFRVYRLQRPIKELAIVADSFHTKPMIRILQSSDRYQVLGLNRQEIRLFEGNRDVLDEIELGEEIPHTISDALGGELTESHLTVASYGGLAKTESAMYHGHGGKKEDIDVDAERFFRAVDRAILDNYSQPSGLPLILATLPEHHHLFHKISTNPFLIREGIDVHPDALPSNDDLRKRAWKVVEPYYMARLTELVEAYSNARANGLGSDDIAEIAKAAISGRVATLLIEANREIPGRIDVDTGDIEYTDLEHPDIDDVLDDLGTLVLKMGGGVAVIPAERMPSKTGVVAIYRY